MSDTLIVTGCPRMGSKSVAQALEMLGLKNVLHFCPVAKLGDAQEFKAAVEDVDSYSALVSNALITVNPLVFAEHPLILLTRDESPWRASMAQFGLDDKECDTMMTYYKNWALDVKIRRGRPNLYPKCLAFDVSDGWGPLCEFLEVEVPEKPFPCLNTSANSFSI